MRGQNEPDFQAVQRTFAAHIRHPELNPVPDGVDPRRMQVYVELFYGTVESVLRGTFPVTRRLLADDAWHALVRDFLHRHACTTPLYREVPEEFLAYLASERGARPDDPPFLLELCHYEWVEMALDIAPDIAEPADLRPDGNLLDDHPVLNPHLRSLCYRFPVHRIRADCLPAEPGPDPTWLMVVRKRDLRVAFVEGNAVTARLVELLRDGGGTGIAALATIASELGRPLDERMRAHGERTLQTLRATDIILGTRSGGTASR